MHSQIVPLGEGFLRTRISSFTYIFYDDNDFCKFWKILEVYVVDRNINGIEFVVEERYTVEFDVHFQSYQFMQPETQQLQIVSYLDFSFYVPLKPRLH